MAIEVCLLFNFAVVFNFNVFPFPPSKAQSLGDFPMNRKNAANCSPLFWIWFRKSQSKEVYYCANILTQQCTMCQYRQATRSEFAACIISKFYFADFFSVRRVSPSNAVWFGASIGSGRCKREKKLCTKLQRFAYSWGHRLLILVYLAETEIHWNGDDWKTKQQTNLDRHGRRPIANICHLPDPTCSHYRLPLSGLDCWTVW